MSTSTNTPAALSAALTAVADWLSTASTEAAALSVALAHRDTVALTHDDVVWTVHQVRASLALAVSALTDARGDLADLRADMAQDRAERAAAWDDYRAELAALGDPLPE